MLWTHRARFSLAIAVVLVCGSQLCCAQSTSHYYRYELSTRTGDNEYRGVIPKPAVTGPSYQVMRDGLGRKLRETDYRDGMPTGIWKYHYTGTARLPDSYETWLNGEHTETTKITRDAQGMIVRYDEFTATGEPTGHTILKDTGDRKDSMHYDVNDKPTYHSVSWYAPSGLLIRRVNYAAATSDQVFTDVQLDQNTGHSLSSKQMNGGKLENTKKWVWSGQDELIRVDVYDENGVWYSADEFEHGLSSRRIYKFINGGTKEIGYSYNEKRWLIKSVLSHNDQLVCTMTYDRLPDGTVQKTVAVGPDGALLGEYPAPAVTDLSENGQPPGRTDGVLHKTGNWW